MGSETWLNAFTVMGAVFAVIALHSAFALSTTEGNTLIKWLYPPLAGVLIAFCVHSVVEIQGYSIKERPIGDYVYVVHAIEGDRALLLVKEGNATRFYEFTVTEADRQALGDAKEGSEEGRKIKLKITDNETDSELIRLDQEFPK